MKIFVTNFTNNEFFFKFNVSDSLMICFGVVRCQLITFVICDNFFPELSLSKFLKRLAVWLQAGANCEQLILY